MAKKNKTQYRVMAMSRTIQKPIEGKSYNGKPFYSKKKVEKFRYKTLHTLCSVLECGIEEVPQDEQEN